METSSTSYTFFLPPINFCSYIDMDMSNVNNCYSFNIHPLNLPSATVRSNLNPKKKRTKFLSVITSDGSKPRTTRKPDPAAPKITRPCTECGKRFWSEKALFGHMRCHPERQWRGINPPPNFRPPAEAKREDSVMTEEDHEVAACLLVLANGPEKWPFACTASEILPEYSNSGRDVNRGMQEHSNSGRAEEENPGDGLASSYQFECSSCKKVFGSHQALGGHRASHKNVKGCYANTKKDEEEEGLCTGLGMSSGHKCSVCLRVFSSGQALGGHKRCHWEKVEETASPASGLDLNFPAAASLVPEDYNYEDGGSSSYSFSLEPLDLRLGL